MSNLNHTDMAIVSAVGVVNAMPFLEDLLTRTITGVVTALVSAIVLHFIKRLWKKDKDESKP